MKSLLKLIRSFWLVALLALFGLCSTTSMSGMTVPAIAYDERALPTIAYDVPSPSIFDYDVAPALPANERERRGAQTSGVFAGFSSFLAAETTAQPLALGLKDAGLEGFAQARGATIATGENWQATVLEKLADPNTPVHFNLDGVDVWQCVQRAASGRGGPTDWELLQIKQNPQFWDSLQFWKGGQPAPNPFK